MSSLKNTNSFDIFNKDTDEDISDVTECIKNILPACKLRFASKSQFANKSNENKSYNKNTTELESSSDSETENTSISESENTSISESENTSKSESENTSKSESENTSKSESENTSRSESRSETDTESELKNDLIFISRNNNTTKKENKKIIKSNTDKMQEAVNKIISNDKFKDDLSFQIMKYIDKIDWELNLNDEDKIKYKSVYKQICSDISNVPKISDILKIPIPYNKKVDIFEKIIILNNIEPNTSEFFQFKKQLNKTIKKYQQCSITEQEYDDYKKIEDSLIDIEYKPIEYQILDMDISESVKLYIYNRYKQLSENDLSNSSNKLRIWIDSILNVPTKMKSMSVSFNDTVFKKNKYLWEIKSQLDKEIYGLEDVKEKILFILNNRITNKESKGLSFALSGPPGVAKTSIVNILSKCVELPFFQINTAGMKDSSYLLGHSYTYEGSGPGIIVQALNTMQYKNGIIYFDEFDKISTTDHGAEISRTLLHITDFTQNNKFHDRYLGEQIDIDLSNIWFIYSLNDKNMIDPTLRDRIPILEIKGYNKKEKIEIAKNYILPKALKNINLEIGSIVFENAALEYLVEISEDEIATNNGKSGVRQLKYYIEDILMKINFLKTVDYVKKLPKFEKLQRYNLKLSFDIKNFQLPLIITKQIIIDLKIKKNLIDKNYLNMYS